jgi:hypothetical protein
LAWLESVKYDIQCPFFDISLFLFCVDDRTSMLPTMDINPFYQENIHLFSWPKHTRFSLFRFSLFLSPIFMKFNQALKIRYIE